ncbi:hypothetical protein F5Y10DRAFT_235414 [Nemania abortiva]|nr:hypothetical protein F5Y10DRAFT_235414 [Nemania abortiva]
MVRTRAQVVARGGHISSVPKDQRKRSGGIRKHKSDHPTTRQRRQPVPERSECDPTNPSSTKETLFQQDSAILGRRSIKRPADVLDENLNSHQKRPRQSPISDKPTANGTYEPTDPIEFWTREGQWPQTYFELDIEHLLTRKKSLSSLRKQSNSTTSTTPSDQKPREEKSAPYRDPRYKTLLETKGSFMDKSDLGIANESKKICELLLRTVQKNHQDSLFRSDIFESTCRNVEDRNEARVIRDITPLIVPPAEILCAYGAKHLRHLIESVNEGWNNSIPLTSIRPQPDYSVGFRREAFTDTQLAKLSPFIGNFIAGDRSFFMATYYMYFPFLTCEVKCGTAALDVADRQNAHSMTLAVRAVAELFRAVKRESEVDRVILGFSISHDHRSVRIYGHYPVICGKDTKYYRHPIRTFDFTELDGKEKWTAYYFTKNVYDRWVSTHFKTICSAIDQLPSNNFDVAPLPEAGVSRDLESRDLSQSDADSMPPCIEHDSQSSNTGQAKGTPGTSFTDSGAAKRRKNKN